MEAEPVATSAHTICGYSWGDVSTALINAIEESDIARALRWSSELVCSDQGLGRLEAVLLNAWAKHVGGELPLWPKTWFNAITKIRELWEKAKGDIKAIRNTPIVRQIVAECVSLLVVSSKSPLPKLPKAEDCFKESEIVRKHIRATGGVGDQYITMRIWDKKQDGEDVRIISNELEAAIKSNNINLVLFWIVWFFTLDKQKDAPQIKERGPGHLSIKQRKSLVWFMMSLIKETMTECGYLSSADRDSLFDCIELCWTKLGEKGRINVVTAITLSMMNLIHNKYMGSKDIIQPIHVKQSVASINNVYVLIAEESRKYLLEVPKIVGLTPNTEKEIKRKEVPLTDIQYKMKFLKMDIL